jgi:hypothetical protein
MRTLFDDLEDFQPTNKKMELKISGSSKTKLSKEQLAFNRLIDRIQNLESTLEIEKDKAEILNNYFEKEVKPQMIKLAEKKLEHAFQLNELSNRFQLSQNTLSQIGDLIVYTCDDVFNVLTVTPEMESLYDDWSEIPYQDELLSQKEDAKADFEEYMNDMFGKSFNMDDVDIDDPESVARFQAKMKELFESSEQETAGKSNRKKSKKQLEKEEQEKATEQLKNKSLRSIYISLTKVLHPDTETDEALKSEKLELMKSVTKAYEEKDLQTLLRLEMEWVFKTSEHLEQLAEEKLKIYTSVLKERVNELEQEKIMIHRNPRFFHVFRFLDLSQQKAMMFIKEEREDRKKAIKYFDSEIKSLNYLGNKKQVKAHINDLHNTIFDSFFDDFMY